MSTKHIGIEGDAIMLELNREYRGWWEAVAYEGDKEYNEHGRCITPVIGRWSKKNVITTVGKGQILDRIFGLGGVIAVAGIAVGTSGTAAGVGDTTIAGAVYKAFAATPVRTALSVAGTTSYTTAEANIAIAEAGSLTASGGILLQRVAPFLSFTKTSAIALDVSLGFAQA